MISTASTFVTSSIDVGHNVVKSILFKLASIFFEIGLFRLLSLLASKLNAFTAYLMFSEDYIQRVLFIISRAFSVNAGLVLCITVLMVGTGLYDTLLWGLDAPGYITKKQNTTASSITSQMLDYPGYVIFSSGTPDQLDSQERQLTELIGSNLYKPGLNFTLTGEVHLERANTLPPPGPLDPNPLRNQGPRLWLDNDGFSVGIDTAVTVGGILPTGERYYCDWEKKDDQSSYWECPFNNSFALMFTRYVLGRPEVHWDRETDSAAMITYLEPSKQDNPWKSLGQGGDTAVMKQVFTVTKGRQRHTFIESTLKVCMIFDYSETFLEDEVEDLVRRTWPTERKDSLIRTISQKVAAARAANNSFQLGWNTQVGNLISQSHYELLNVEGLPGQVLYSLFRISVVEILLVQSETLPRPVKPFEPCTRFFVNEARGGTVFRTDCYKAWEDPVNQTEAPVKPRFLGQLDTSAVLILNGFLGDGTRNVSSKALDERAYQWWAKNAARLAGLLLSRGFILASDPSLVKIEISYLRPAISYLQVTLIAVATLFGVAGAILLFVFDDGHYSSSLLANLYFTTNVEGPKAGHKPKYMRRMQEISLSGRGGEARMQTSKGVFKNEPL